MSQSDVSKAEAADQRSEQTRSFVRRVRAATRRKYTPEEKIRIVLEGFRREVTVNDLCRREGIKPHSYYSWTKEFMEAGRERLSHGARCHPAGDPGSQAGERRAQAAGSRAIPRGLPSEKTAIPMIQAGQASGAQRPGCSQEHLLSVVDATTTSTRSRGPTWSSKRENGELKQLVAELSLEVYRLKKTAIPMPQNGVGTSG